MIKSNKTTKILTNKESESTGKETYVEGQDSRDILYSDLMVPSPTPFWPASSSSSSRKLRGITETKESASADHDNDDDNDDDDNDDAWHHWNKRVITSQPPLIIIIIITETKELGSADRDASVILIPDLFRRLPR